MAVVCAPALPITHVVVAILFGDWRWWVLLPIDVVLWWILTPYLVRARALAEGVIFG